MAQKILSLWLCMALASAPHLSAQSFHFDRIGAAEGLSQGMVYDLMQCSRGFLWAATKDGLNRFDGYGFQVFQNSPFDPFTLSDNEVKVVMEDSRGRIWAGTLLSGLNVLDPSSGRIYQVEGLSSLQVNALAEAPDGSIWVGTEAGVNRVRLPEKLPSDKPKLSPAATQLDTIFWSAAYLKTYAVVDVAFDSKGLAWVSTHEYLGIFDAENRQFRTVWENTIPPDKEVVTSFFKPMADGTVWVGQLDKLLRFRGGRVDVFLLPHQSLYPYVDMAFDRSGDMYVSNRKFIFKFSQPDKASPEDADIKTIYRFPENGIMGSTKLLFDRNGLLWVGTNGYGLLKHTSGNPHFRHYLAGKSPRRLHVDRQNRVWVWNSGSKFGLLDKNNDAASEPLLTDPQYHQHDCTSTPDGTLWVLCESTLAEPKKNGVLVRLDGVSLKVLAKYPLPIDVGMFGRLYTDSNGKLWVLGAKSTLLNFDPAAKRTEVHDFGAVTGYQELALAFHTDPNGHYWIGTPHGLIRAVPEGQKLRFTLYVNAPSDPNSLRSNYILCLLDDPLQPAKYCWVGTRGGGVSRLDKVTGQFENYTTASGLPNNVVYGIIAESPSFSPTYLWLSTNRGLSRFCPSTGTFQNFFSADGLQDNEFNTISFTQSAAGECYFGGVNGITAFFPTMVQSAYSGAEVQLTGLLVNNQPYLPLGMRLADQSIELKHSQNLLTFSFAAMDFAAPQMNQYRYRLIGVDRDWVKSTTKNAATYAHLRPGQYVFEVMTGGSRGIWNENVARLSICILPPWWRTGWAYALYGAALLAGMWALYRFQVNRARLKGKLEYEKREAARLVEIDKLKTDFFSSMTHELRTPLTLLLEPARQMLREITDQGTRYRLQLIESNAERLLHFVNQMLDLSKLDAGQLPLDLKVGNPVVAAKSVFAQFQSVAEGRGIQLTADWPQEAGPVCYDEGKWGQIVSNLLSNAIKFTETGGEVALSMEAVPHGSGNSMYFNLTVSDTGTGIAPEDLPKVFDRFYQTKHGMGGTGIGLALCKEFAERMGGGIAVQSVLGEGSSFSVTILCEPCEHAGAHASGAALSPAAQPLAPIAVSLAAAAAPAPNDDAAPLLLIVEDNSDLRRFLRESMPPSYRIAEAADGAEGIEMALDLVPDLVVSDLVMPRKDGFEVVKSLKENPATSHVPIVLLTGQPALEAKLRGLRYGADAYLTKPFRSEELVAHIENLLASRRRLQAYFSKGNSVATTARQLAQPENDFLQKLIQTIEDNLDNDEMGAADFAKAMFVSRSQLHRKISALTGLSLTEFVRNHRLDRAKEMLLRNEGPVADIAWRTGFRSTKYFATSFKERFGQTPSSVAAKGA